MDTTLDTCWRFQDGEINEHAARAILARLGWDEELAGSMIESWKAYGRPDPDRWRWRELRYRTRPTDITLTVRRASCVVPGCTRTEHYARFCRLHTYLGDFGVCTRAMRAAGRAEAS